MIQMLKFVFYLICINIQPLGICFIYETSRFKLRQEIQRHFREKSTPILLNTELLRQSRSFFSVFVLQAQWLVAINQAVAKVISRTTSYRLA